MKNTETEWTVGLLIGICYTHHPGRSSDGRDLVMVMVVE